MFALNQGEVCTCPSRALIQSDIYDDPIGKAVERVKAIKQGNPLDTDTMMGAWRASNDQFEKISSYLNIGKEEGAKVLTGGEAADLGGDLSGGYYIQPTVFAGDNKMRIFQEEISVPSWWSPSSTPTRTRWASPTTPCTDSVPACGPATVPPPTARAARSRPVACGPTPTTTTRHTPPSVSKQSGIGRENHLMMLSTISRRRTCWSVTPKSAKGFF